MSKVLIRIVTARETLKKKSTCYDIRYENILLTSLIIQCHNEK